MVHIVKVLFLFVFLFAKNNTSAQVATTGQILLNGNASFFTAHSASDGATAATLINGLTVPAFSFQQKQDANNLTLAPKAHYFLTDKWSLGLGFGWRRIVSDRYIPSILSAEVPTYIAFSRTTKNKTITSSYAPQLELARHWKITDRFAINLTAYAGWQFTDTKRKTSTNLSLTSVVDITGWTVSDGGLRFTPENKNLTSTKEKAQTWFLGVYPQIRYAFTDRFGMTAIIGGVGLSQKIKNTVTSFNKSNPDFSLNINPTSWTFGVFYVLDGGGAG